MCPSIPPCLLQFLTLSVCALAALQLHAMPWQQQQYQHQMHPYCALLMSLPLLLELGKAIRLASCSISNLVLAVFLLLSLFLFLLFY